jgi:hypothetical protein
MPCVSGDDFSAIVCGGVIEQNNFEISKSLLQYGAYSPFEESTVIVVWDDD